jgi:molybdenum cofactor cytidylyltransferase
LRRPAAEGGGRRQLIAALLLAAGESKRFGRQKLLESWEGEPLVRHAARRLLEAGFLPVVAVVSADQRLSGALSGLPLMVVVNAHQQQGISRSIAIGLQALPADVPAALIAVADQPELTSDGLRQLSAAFRPGRIVVPRYRDHRGNPAIFDRAFFAELGALQGDRGGQQVVARHPDSVEEVRLPAAMGEDIDRPEQWPA